MTCEALTHMLSHETLCMTRELLDAIQANFSDKAKTVSHLSGGDGGDDPGSS
jgi:hypothetical protein